MKKYWTPKPEAGHPGDVLTYGLFLIYLAALVWILLFKLGVQFDYMTTRSVNLIPFGELSLSRGRIDWSELLLNVVIFVPFGIYASVLFRGWSFRKILLLVVVLTLTLETMQYLLRIGAFDSTDIVTNTTGGILGWLVYQLILKLTDDSTSAQKFINLMALTGTVIMVVLLVLLKTNHLGIRYQ